MTNSTDPIAQFEREKKERMKRLGCDEHLRSLSRQWLQEAMRKGYTYNFSWLGRPIIQFPGDILALQEIIWRIQPGLIIETGIAHGGSIIHSAAMLELVAACGGPSGRVMAVDIDIRAHNREAIESHPLSRRIEMLEGSSIQGQIIERVRERARGEDSVLICLDSYHTHDHVLAELEAYAPLTSLGSYCLVFDTFVEESDEDLFPDRPWKRGNNPMTAVLEFLKRLETEQRLAADGKRLLLAADREWEDKLLITGAPSGFLKRLYI